MARILAGLDTHPERAQCFHHAQNVVHSGGRFERDMETSRRSGWISSRRDHFGLAHCGTSRRIEAHFYLSALRLILSGRLAD